jgi:histidinol-phosphatase
MDESIVKLNEIEQTALDDFRKGENAARSSQSDHSLNAWLKFSLCCVLDADRTIRRHRIHPLNDVTEFKKDGTPVTNYEIEIERAIRDQLAGFCSNAVLIGEESGGIMPESGVSVSVDPVDGTWALLNRMSTTACVFVVARDGSPKVAVVANPSTGEISYAVGEQQSRLLQLDLFGEEDHAVDLPLDRLNAGAPLVHVQASRQAGPLVQQFVTAWSQDEVRLVRMESGSPSLAIVEAAKGSFVYVNLWSKRLADPYDLLAAVKIMRNAGGDVVDLHGRPIESTYHKGPFVAGVDRQATAKVAEIVATL